MWVQAAAANRLFADPIATYNSFPSTTRITFKNREISYKKLLESRNEKNLEKNLSLDQVINSERSELRLHPRRSKFFTLLILTNSSFLDKPFKCWQTIFMLTNNSYIDKTLVILTNPLCVDKPFISWQTFPVLTNISYLDKPFITWQTFPFLTTKFTPSCFDIQNQIWPIYHTTVARFARTLGDVRLGLKRHMIKEKLSCQFSHEIAEFVKAAACYYPLALSSWTSLAFSSKTVIIFSKDDIWPTNQTLLIRTRVKTFKNL